MDWSALKSNECPACGFHMKHADKNGMVKCENEDCEFRIGEARLKQLLEDMDQDAEFSERDY